MNDAARSELLFEFRVFWIEIAFRFFLGIQVIEIAKEFIETMICRQKLIAIAEMNDGSFWSDEADVVVTLAACVEGL